MPLSHLVLQVGGVSLLPIGTSRNLAEPSHLPHALLSASLSRVTGLPPHRMCTPGGAQHSLLAPQGALGRDGEETRCPSWPPSAGTRRWGAPKGRGGGRGAGAWQVISLTTKLSSVRPKARPHHVCCRESWATHFLCREHQDGRQERERVCGGQEGDLQTKWHRLEALWQPPNSRERDGEGCAGLTRLARCEMDMWGRVTRHRMPVSKPGPRHLPWL